MLIEDVLRIDVARLLAVLVKPECTGKSREKVDAIGATMGMTICFERKKTPVSVIPAGDCACP
jgi:quinolinate synthase